MIGILSSLGYQTRKLGKNLNWNCSLLERELTLLYGFSLNLIADFETIILWFLTEFKKLRTLSIPLSSFLSNKSFEFSLGHFVRLLTPFQQFHLFLLEDSRIWFLRKFGSKLCHGKSLCENPKTFGQRKGLCFKVTVLSTDPSAAYS